MAWNIFEIGEEQLRSVTEIGAEIAVLMCEPVVDPDLQITGGGGASVWSKTKGEGSLP